MIISGGTLRGRKLAAPAGNATRPTPARVKEAVFSILREQVPGARVLDCFAGTGALGFEALSRGAASLVAVEAHGRTAAAIAAAAKQFGLADCVTVITGRIERNLSRLAGPFDLVFLDPPYAQEPPHGLFAALRELRLLAPSAVLAYEHPSDRAGFRTPEHFELLKEAHWGEVGFRFYAPTLSDDYRELSSLP